MDRGVGMQVSILPGPQQWLAGSPFVDCSKCEAHPGRAAMPGLPKLGGSLARASSPCMVTDANIQPTCFQIGISEWHWTLQMPKNTASAIECLHLSHNDLLVVQQGPSAQTSPASPMNHATPAEV